MAWRSRLWHDSSCLAGYKQTSSWRHNASGSVSCRCVALVALGGENEGRLAKGNVVVVVSQVQNHKEAFCCSFCHWNLVINRSPALASLQQIEWFEEDLISERSSNWRT